MSQKVQVILLCDLDDGNVDAQETLLFSLGNNAYEVDVCAKHAQQIRDGVEPFPHTPARRGQRATAAAASARRPTGSRPPASAHGRKTAASRSTTAAVFQLP